jgi:hypothetical protein
LTVERYTPTRPQKYRDGLRRLGALIREAVAHVVAAVCGSGEPHVLERVGGVASGGCGRALTIVSNTRSEVVRCGCSGWTRG